MLANGIMLGYKASGATDYTDLKGLKKVPDMGNEPEKVENTTLADKTKQYEFGIGDYGDLEYTFKYANSSSDSSYRVLRKLSDDKTVVEFQQSYPDGTKFIFKAQCSVKLGGGEVNGVIDFTLKLALQSDIAVTDPTEKTAG
ncbi:phage tail tube protein [Clostridium sp. HBUAS56017]|uniref:phage tail tube protein n=1 Tax=Clostridium sp. HBUAS56017 TaxID=2571128 RepID=UPI001177F8F3|nr:phage tail tube protein [Clostridium sp. HBUAS56017]